MHVKPTPAIILSILLGILSVHGSSLLDPSSPRLLQSTAPEQQSAKTTTRTYTKRSSSSSSATSAPKGLRSEGKVLLASMAPRMTADSATAIAQAKRNATQSQMFYDKLFDDKALSECNSKCSTESKQNLCKLDAHMGYFFSECDAHCLRWQNYTCQNAPVSLEESLVSKRFQKALQDPFVRRCLDGCSPESRLLRCMDKQDKSLTFSDCQGSCFNLTNYSCFSKTETRTVIPVEIPQSSVELGPIVISSTVPTVQPMNVVQSQNVTEVVTSEVVVQKPLLKPVQKTSEIVESKKEVKEETAPKTSETIIKDQSIVVANLTEIDHNLAKDLNSILDKLNSQIEKKLQVDAQKKSETTETSVKTETKEVSEQPAAGNLLTTETNSTTVKTTTTTKPTAAADTQTTAVKAQAAPAPNQSVTIVKTTVVGKKAEKDQPAEETVMAKAAPSETPALPKPVSTGGSSYRERVKKTIQETTVSQTPTPVAASASASYRLKLPPKEKEPEGPALVIQIKNGAVSYRSTIKQNKDLGGTTSDDTKDLFWYANDKNTDKGRVYEGGKFSSYWNWVATPKPSEPKPVTVTTSKKTSTVAENLQNNKFYNLSDFLQD